MKLNPQKAPLYGHCVITVQLTDEELSADSEGVDYFLLFAGSTQRHLTSTLRSSHDTLQALCPAHDCCEVVSVTLCSVTRGIPEGEESPPGRVAPLAEHRFSFVQDLAFDMAQFLVSTAGRADGLDGALMLDECQIPLQECERLDENLALALHHLTLPPGWSLLGNKRTNSTDPNPQETLLHFSARRGLLRVTRFLLRQPGAREALRLVNRQGDTPSSIAASRGNEDLCKVLAKAETDSETERESVQLGSADARVRCHLPVLNTHTLTLSVHPSRDTPTLQESVEQLLHLICHLHAKGVSVLELQFDSLHAAAECCDGVEERFTCLGPSQQPQCLVAATEGSGVENVPPRSDSTESCGDGETGAAEEDLTSPESIFTSEVTPQEHGLGPPEDWVCLSSNAGGEHCQTEEEEEKEKEEEGKEQPVVSTQSLSLCDRSEAEQSEAKGESLTVGILPPTDCDKQAEETDRGETVIREEQEAEKGEDRTEKETEDTTAERREEEEEKKEEEEEEEVETNSETAGLITTSGDTKAPVMGQSLSSECSETSDGSDSDVNAEGARKRQKSKEDTESFSQEACDGLSEEKEEAGREELTESSSHPGDLPNPALIDSDDVMKETDSAVPPLLIEGLHEGEPPPDINSPEQNQETAGRDYAAEQQRGLAPQTSCHSGNCSEAASREARDGEDAAETSGYTNTDLPADESNSTADCRTSGDFLPDTESERLNCEEMLMKGGAEQESGATHGTSSDEDGSFRSVGSSTTEIYHPTQEDGTVEGSDCLQATTVESSNSKPNESDDNFLSVDGELPLEPGTVSAATQCDQDGTEPDSLQTMEALSTEGMEELTPEPSKEDVSLEPAVSESEDTHINESEAGESSHSDLGVAIEPSVPEEIKAIGVVEEDIQLIEQSDTSAVVAAEESGNVQYVPQQPKQDSSEMTPDEKPVSDVDPASSNTEASSEPLVQDPVAENPKTCDVVDGVPESCSSTLQEVDVIMSEEAVSDEAKKEEDGPAEEALFSTIHRDRDSSFHQPCNTQHSGSSQSSTLPSLSSRTSSATSRPSSTHRDSGSDTENFLNVEPTYDSVFRKNDEPVTGGDSTSEVSVSISCSSTDDTASVGPPSSSPEGSQGLSCSWSPEEGSQTQGPVTAGLDSSGGGGGGGGAAGDAEEEAKDRVTEVPRRSCVLRNSVRSVSPLRRHSWGPGKNHGGDAEMNQRSSTRSPAERKPAFHRRSYSLEGLSGGQEELRGPATQGPRILEPSRMPRQDSDDRGSLVSLTEEQEDHSEHHRLHDLQKSRRYRPLRSNGSPMTLPLTKSVSMLAINHRDIDGSRLFSTTSGPLAYSISEEEPGPLRSDTEGKGVTKVSRTFSYLKNKMYKKTREKEREKREKDKEGKEKDKKSVNGHVFTPLCSNQAAQCSQCNKAFNNKEAFYCSYCYASVHKGCRDALPVCAKVKMKIPKQQFAVPDSSSVSTVTMRNKSGGTRERPWSAILTPEDHSSLTMPAPRRPTSIMAFHGNNLSKSLSISNIAGPVFDEMPIKGLRYLSQSTDSLNRTNQVTESMESLTDEGTEMMDGQLMGEFEADSKEMEADSWSLGVEQQYLQQLDRELVKRQDVIYELMQTEMHHIRTLRIMSEVYSKGLQKEVQLEQQTVERLFPALDELLELHTQHLLRLLERKKESQLEAGGVEGGFIISRIGDILVSQFSGSNGETMKKVYGRFCSRHNEAVNFYKDLLTKDKRFKAFIKKKMSSSIVRRLGIPECILLVTQRITKYPVLIQRMLQHTKESEEDYDDLTEAVRLVKEVIASVDSKVNEHDKRRRLREFHSRMDSKSIMMMKSGQIFAREDLLRRRLIHDGALQLKNVQGRLKDVHALLLSDVFVFLQEKDQKYVFAMLDQRSTVISLQKLIVREVANEERGLFLITAGIEKPEMVEVLASSKDERNTWMQLIQEAMQSMEKDEDEGIPSETEDDKRQLETKAKEMRDMLRQKDTEIMSLLEEKVRLFRGMWEGLNPGEEACRQLEPFFRSASGPEPPRGAAIMKDALQEVETLQALVNGSLGGAMASVQETAAGGGGGGGGCAGPVCLPRRAETFGGFDSHQMHSSKSGDRDESEEMAGDLRRTESDSVLKKGGNANLLLLLKRNSEQVLHSVSNLHLLLSTLQAVVVQQDSFIEDQRQALSERSSSCSSLSRASSRPSSLIEQEKQRSLEKQRQELASLQRQQAAHAEEKRRREREWELREQRLSEREGLLHRQEEDVRKQHRDLEEEKQELQSRKEEYQKDLERLRDAQRKLERDREAVQRQLDRMEELRVSERTSSTTSDESHFPGSSHSLELDPLELCPSSSSSLPRLQPQRSKTKGKGLNPFTSSSGSLKGGEANNQLSKGLLQLAKNKSKEGKEKKKKKSKGGNAQTADSQHLPEPPLDGEIFFC
ncbi:A-kinase anchor protein 13 isoform X2 [Salarias fasciatus]|uniref:A-kinase anchor protein 13 isoform X2 n=1 Tax=Salarias fasciatus TaxID=181472 RepID=UPI001176542E|nr:A-kinase anchor protein 13 isoform X2 [Salarias fasciatus]